MNASDILYLHGATDDDLLIGSFDAYVRPYDEPTWTPRFVGVTTKEKTLSPSWEYAEFWDGMPQALWATHVTKVELSMKFGFVQLGDPVTWGFLFDTTLDLTDPATAVQYFGSNPAQPPDFTWWFIGQTVDGRSLEIVFRRGRITNPEDLEFGTGDYTVGNVSVRALTDTAVCDTEQNMAYVCIERLSTPSGGYVDPCASSVTFCEP